MNTHIQESYDLYINGQWVPASDGKTFKAYNPANGDVLSTCAEATKEDVDTAVAAAHEALRTWRLVEPIERQKILLKIADIIDENKEHLAMIETLDNGKPIRETLNVDIPAAADHFRYFAGAIRTGRPGSHARQQHHEHRAPRTDRRCRPDCSLELPVPHGRLEISSGPGCRLHDRHQTVEQHVPECP